MSGEPKIHHIVNAKDFERAIDERQAGDYLLLRTSTWTIAQAPDDDSVIAIFADTAAGIIGLEFPKSEAEVLARQLLAITTAPCKTRQ